VDNPVEMCGATEYTPDLYQRVLAPILDAGAADLVLLFGGYALYDEPAADFLDGRRRAHGVPILVHDLYAGEQRPALQRLRIRGLPVYASAEVAARVAGALYRGVAARQRAVRWRPQLAPLPAAAGWSVLAAAARRRASLALTEDEASRLLAAFGIPLLPASLARSADEAVAAARQLGPSIALKVHAAEIVHKSDVGGVHLDLRTEDDVRRAFEAAARAAQAAGAVPEVRLTPMRRGGLEALVGARRDSQFGPVLVFGAGGLHAEAHRDVALRLLPCDAVERRAMVEATTLGRALAAPRTGAVDAAALDTVLAGVSQLLAACPEVSDVEINPLSCAHDGVVALDARVLLSAT
jgi:acetyltransferase